MSDVRKRTSAVPKGRLERLAHIGAAATSAALSNASLRAKRLLGGDEIEGVLTVPGARKLAKRLSRLRGAAMKLGQMASISSDSMIPPEIAEALSVLRAAADAMPEHQVRDQLVRNLGPDWESHFEHFEMEPMASASIGQVHRARTTDGEEVVLKVQYPGVRASIDSDVDNLASLLKLWRYLPGNIEFDGVIEETKRQLRHEADYRHEAENTKRYYELFSDFPGVEIPKVFDALCADEVLTTSYVSGQPLLEAAEFLSQERRDSLADRLLRLTCSELFVHRFMQTDPNPGNFLYREADDTLVLLDFGACDEIGDSLLEGYRQMTLAVINGDRPGLEHGLEQLGFFLPEDPRDMRDDILDMVVLSSEPLLTDAPYDYGDSDLSDRARAKGIELAKNQRLTRTPPPETLFVQRKLGGAFLLASKMKARVACRPMLRELLAS